MQRDGAPEWLGLCVFVWTCSQLRWEADHSSGLNHRQMWPSSCLCPPTVPVKHSGSLLSSVWSLKFKSLWINPFTLQTILFIRSTGYTRLTSFLSHTSMSHWWKNSILLSRMLSFSTFMTCKMGFSVCLLLNSEFNKLLHPLLTCCWGL